MSCSLILQMATTVHLMIIYIFNIYFNQMSCVSFGNFVKYTGFKTLLGCETPYILYYIYRISLASHNRYSLHSEPYITKINTVTYSSLLVGLFGGPPYKQKVRKEIVLSSGGLGSRPTNYGDQNIHSGLFSGDLVGLPTIGQLLRVVICSSGGLGPLPTKKQI